MTTSRLRLLRRSAERTVRLLRLIRSMNQPVEYLAAARKAASRSPHDEKVLTHLLQTLRDNEQWDAAADTASRVVSISSDPEIQIVSAWGFLTVGRGDAVLAAAAKILEGQPVDVDVVTEAIFLRGAGNAVLGEMELAEPDLREAVARNDQSPTSGTWRSSSMPTTDATRRLSSSQSRGESLTTPRVPSRLPSSLTWGSSLADDGSLRRRGRAMLACLHASVLRSPER